MIHRLLLLSIMNTNNKNTSSYMILNWNFHIKEENNLFFYHIYYRNQLIAIKANLIDITFQGIRSGLQLPITNSSILYHSITKNDINEDNDDIDNDDNDINLVKKHEDDAMTLNISSTQLLLSGEILYIIRPSIYSWMLLQTSKKLTNTKENQLYTKPIAMIISMVSNYLYYFKHLIYYYIIY